MAEYNSSEIHWPFVSFQNLNSLYFTYFFVRVHSFYHSLSITVTHCIFFCYSLSFVVTLCHSLPLVATLLPLLVPLVTCCTTCRHSLLLVVNRCSTRCQSLYYSLSLVITRCTTRLSFYKWSYFESNIKKFWYYSYANQKIISHKIIRSYFYGLFK